MTFANGSGHFFYQTLDKIKIISYYRDIKLISL